MCLVGLIANNFLWVFCCLFLNCLRVLSNCLFVCFKLKLVYLCNCVCFCCQIRKTKGISVFPVAFAGGLKYVGPVCKHGRVLKWHRVFAKERFVYIYYYVSCPLPFLLHT